MRGEYENFRYDFFPDSELPPRARRILKLAHNDFPISGTTSACAENTIMMGSSAHPNGNYLRVRGEYNSFGIVSIVLVELPPRARRIHREWACYLDVFGTTSACAENTEWCVMYVENERNYLRVRGEYGSILLTKLSIEELPPRARRILFSSTVMRLGFGTTSACAENTEPYH